MTDLARLRGFLDELGLTDFQAVFEENDIGMDLIPELTQDDLKELGLNIGQRRRLTSAAEELKNLEGEAREARLKPERRQISNRCETSIATAITRYHGFWLGCCVVPRCNARATQQHARVRVVFNLRAREERNATDFCRDACSGIVVKACRDSSRGREEWQPG